MDEEIKKDATESGDKPPDSIPPIPPAFAQIGNEPQEVAERAPEEKQERASRGVGVRNFKETIDKGSSKESGSGRLPLGKIDQQDLQRVQDLFVPSSDYRNKLGPAGSRPDYNIWVVHGPEYAGKLTTALKLALDLLHCEPKTEKVYCYRRSLADSLALIELVRSKDFESVSACVLEDVFDRNVDFQELESPWLEALDRSLKDKKAFLILTTELELRDLETLNIGKIASFPDDLFQVFERHLNRFTRHVEGVDVLEEVGKAARDQWTSVSHYLKKPVQIERFCYKLGDLREKVSDEIFVNLAREAAYIGKTSVRRAFCALGNNEKLYALLAVLFDGIERAALDEIYVLAVQHLRSERVSTLQDEREIGLDDILEQIRASESATRQVLIEDGEFREEILRQARNHRRLLHSLSMPFLHLCEKASGPENWELRRAIGAAIGRLGALEKNGLEPISDVLDTLADHPLGGVASVAGYVLDQVCRDSPQLRSDVLARLQSWIESGDPDRMWAAGAAAWRIYEGIGSAPGQRSIGDWHHRTLDTISSLIRNADRFSLRAINEASPERIEFWIQENLSCAFFALVRIISTSPLSAVGKLEEWLGGKPGDPVREIAHLACGKVLEQGVSEERAPAPEHRAWLQLIKAILSLDPDVAGVGDALMAALANWSRWSNEKDGSDMICVGLMAAATRLSGRPAKSLRAGLVRYWLTSEAEPVRRRGRALLRRSHAMEGLPLRDLQPVRGLVALDASQDAMVATGSSRLSRELLQVVGCYVDLTVAHMGGARVKIHSDEGVNERALRSPFPRPRLLVPVTEGRLEGDPGLVLALAWGPILDLGDSEEMPWSPPLLVTAGDWSETSDSGEKPEKTGEARYLQSIPLTQDLDGVVKGIVRFLNTKAAQTLREISSVVFSGEELAALDRIEEKVSSPDLGDRIVSELLELSVTDFSASLEKIRGWLEEPGASELIHRVASAGLRALLRFYAEPGQRPPDTEKEKLLRLAFLIPPTDEGAAETVLETVLAWMDEDAWAERIAGSGDLCSAWMRWFEALIPHQGRSLDRWLSARELEEASQGNGKVTAVLRALGWLRFRLSLGSGGTLPALEDGRGYGLFLLDAFSFERGAALAQLVVDLLEHPQLRDVPSLVFRLGRRAPLTLPGEKLGKEAVLPSADARLPRLLGPILEALPPERILFALVLAAGPAVDAGDWSEAPWYSRLRLYGPVEGLTLAEPFVRISPPREDKEVDAILRNLMPLINQGA